MLCKGRIQYNHLQRLFDGHFEWDIIRWNENRTLERKRTCALEETSAWSSPVVCLPSKHAHGGTKDDRLVRIASTSRVGLRLRRNWEVPWKVSEGPSFVCASLHLRFVQRIQRNVWDQDTLSPIEYNAVSSGDLRISGFTSRAL